jgi:hypothetical protein
MSGMGTVVHEDWPWLALILLGAYHGLNPAMGWFFAVALGLQEKAQGGRHQGLLAHRPRAHGRRRPRGGPPPRGNWAPAPRGARPALALQVVVPLGALRYVAAAALILFGLYKLIRRKHPRWVGMRVGFKDLTAWSFIMANAHGARLMLVSVLLGLSGTMQEMEHRAHEAHEHWGHSLHLFLTNPALADMAAVAVTHPGDVRGDGGGCAGHLRQARPHDPQAHLVQRRPPMGGGTGWGGCDHASHIEHAGAVRERPSQRLVRTAASGVRFQASASSRPLLCRMCQCRGIIRKKI